MPGLTSLAPLLYERIGMQPPQIPADMNMLRRLFYDAEWWQVYDLSEAMLAMCSFREQITDRIEAIFATEQLLYRFTLGGIEWRFPEVTAEVIGAATRRLTESTRLAAVAAQWQKALAHLSERPPDSENCIKDAVGALEGTVRILSGKHTPTFSSLITPFSRQINMHPALAGVVEKVYAYRGDEQGVAHGATKEARDLTAEAEMVLHVSAASIIYFEKKSHCQTV